MYTSNRLLKETKEYLLTPNIPITVDARAVAMHAARLLNEKDDLLVKKEQQLRNLRKRVMNLEQQRDQSKRELIRLSEII